METIEIPTAGAFFKILGVDDLLYGPVDLPNLIQWVQDERITANTWIHNANTDKWEKACNVPELHLFFDDNSKLGEGLRPGILRRIKILADLNDAQLQRFALFMEYLSVPKWSEVVKQGDHSDSMFLVLEGELRVRFLIGGKETILTTLLPGDFFGEVALFDHGPRSADVVSNMDSNLLKISSEAFGILIREAPEIAAPFLAAIGKTLVSRIRADNKRYRDSIAFARSSKANA